MTELPPADQQDSTASPGPPRTLSSLLRGTLPLQDETNWFILANVLDIFLTLMLLFNGAIEANPIADAVLQRWGFEGMVAFKLVIVASISVLAQIVALQKPHLARFVLWFGTAVTGAVVAYSMLLFTSQIYG